MNIDVTTKEFEVSRATYARFSLQLNGWRIGLFTVLCATMGAMFLYTSKPGTMGQGLGWFAAIYGPIFLLQQVVIYKRTFFSHENRFLFEPVVVQFSEVGLTVSGKSGSASFSPWSHVLSAYRNGDVWVLQFARIQFLLVPDSAYERGDDLTAVNEFLQTRYGSQDSEQLASEVGI